jgi:menaquinone-dependent protoporphyrinogen oxidase
MQHPKPGILVIYATWHGQAREVAERFASIALANGADAEVREAGEVKHDDVSVVDGVVIVGSVHFGSHGGVLRRLARRELKSLARVRSAFISVSGASASLEGRDQAEHYIQRFLRATGWRPDLILPCAGAIPFTKYDPFTRALMKFASRTAGRATDTSRDYVYTNWQAVDAFTHDFLGVVERSNAIAGPAASVA